MGNLGLARIWNHTTKSRLLLEPPATTSPLLRSLARSLASPELGRAGRRPALFIGRRLRYGPPVHSLLTAHLQYSHGGDACCCLVLQHHRERISFQKFRLLT